MKYFGFLLLLLSLSACSNSVTEEPTESIELPTVNPDRVFNVAFLIVDGVYNSELVAPMDIFHHTVFHTENGMKVFTVGPGNEPVTTFEGLRIIPDYGWTDSIPSIDVLVVPSAKNSMGSDLENEEMMNFVRESGLNAQYIMSLCDGAFVLAKAGLLDGLESTTFPSDIPKYRETFPELKVHEGVSFVHDGKAITSAGGAKSYDPALYLSELLYGQKTAVGIAKGLVIDWELANIQHVRKQP